MNKRYLLLRNNEESGPHTFEALRALHLLPTDLVWIEGESTSWAYPQELEELAGAVEEPARPNGHGPARSGNIFISLPANFSRKRRKELSEAEAAWPAADDEGVLETNLVQSLPELKERLEASGARKPVWKKSLVPVASLLNVVVVFVAMTGCALLIKKIVDGSENTSLATEQAVPATLVADEARTSETHVVPTPEPVQPPSQLASTAVEKMPLKTVKLRDIKKQVRVKTNDYHVGLLGGINGLELTGYNSLPPFVDKVLVAVDYLKRNGKIIGSEQYEISSLRPNASKKLPVPRSSRGGT